MHKKTESNNGNGTTESKLHGYAPFSSSSAAIFLRFTVMWRVLSVSVCSALVFASAATAPTDVPAGLTNDAWTNELQASSCRCIPNGERAAARERIH